jgi:hypothetical protein
MLLPIPGLKPDLWTSMGITKASRTSRRAPVTTHMRTVVAEVYTAPAQVVTRCSGAFDVTITAIAEFVSDPDAFGGAP